MPPQPEKRDSTWSGRALAAGFFPPERRMGFTASSGMIQTPLCFLAPGIRPWEQ